MDVVRVLEVVLLIVEQGEERFGSHLALPLFVVVGAYSAVADLTVVTLAL